MGRDLSDSELAAELGVARSTISHWRSRGLPQAVTCLLPYLNPAPGPQAVSASAPALAPAPETPARVRHRALAELLAAVVEHYEALESEYARAAFVADVYGLSSALGARRSALGAIITHLGWTVIDGGRRDAPPTRIDA